MRPIASKVIALALLCSPVMAQSGPTPEQKDQEAALTARMTRKRQEAQGYYQKYMLARRNAPPATAQAYLDDANRLMGESDDSEFSLVDLLLTEGRDKEAKGHLLTMARRGNPVAANRWCAMEYAEAEDLYRTGAKKASIDKLQALHLKYHYKPAEEALKALDIL